MALETYIGLLWIAVLPQNTWSQSCPNVECAEGADEIMKSSQVQSLLQKNLDRKKVMASVTNEFVRGGRCMDHDYFYVGLLRPTQSCAELASLPAQTCKSICQMIVTGRGVKLKEVCCSSCNACLGYDAGCPASCHESECGDGDQYNGGLPLENGRCNFHCSQPFSGGYRYCGSGEEYSSGDSVDCSGCAAAHIHASDGSMTCPSGYGSLLHIDNCKAGIAIGAQQHPWAGESEDCRPAWPKAGCFSFADKLYFSTCEDDRPLSQNGHSGICKKLEMLP
mmetsp:Transcript_124766/g.216348  ORF Transcript_124766/g.216348 Transcript_124766/m.216348 type:complete len:279 (+) Transcript_124766:94-930(+)